jgi:hypothetical protein
METTTASTASTTNNNEAIEDFLEGNFINIKDGESRILSFRLDGESIVEKLDFNGNPVKKVQFLVKDPNRDPNQTEKKMELSRKHAAKIHKELKAGHTIIQVSRFGTGKETNYHVRPVN